MRLIDADAMKEWLDEYLSVFKKYDKSEVKCFVEHQPSIDMVRCKDCRKSHIDGKTTHYLWCVEWGRSTDVFGYCERGEREGE